MSNLAVIPARGGSKRIPRKNIKEFLGKPIIAYSIDIALNSGLFDEVMVSTDDKEIAEVAEKYGATVPFFRSDEVADDFATLADVMDEVLDCYRKKDEIYKYVCCILPTAPLINPKIFRKCYDIISGSDEYDSVRTITPFNFPVQRAQRYIDGKTEYIWPAFEKSRSQDLEAAYHDTGQFYWVTFKKGMHSANGYRIIIPNVEVQDIDNEDDWKLAELKYQLMKDKLEKQKIH